jgi:hypothetical protein
MWTVPAELDTFHVAKWRRRFGQRRLQIQLRHGSAKAVSRLTRPSLGREGGFGLPTQSTLDLKYLFPED